MRCSDIEFTRLELRTQMGTGDDRRVDLQEFKRGLLCLGLSMRDAEAEAEFQLIDQNGGGQILFDEVCEWFLSKKGQVVDHERRRKSKPKPDDYDTQKPETDTVQI